jgi:hypothetical protein
MDFLFSTHSMSISRNKLNWQEIPPLKIQADMPGCGKIFGMMGRRAIN